MSVLSIDKPVGPTSHDAVDRARRALGTRRVGHFGTLDPFASGLLVLGVGPSTRLAPFTTGHAKTYHATVRLGERSDTDDSAGAIEAVAGVVPPDRAAVERACAAWVGDVLQVPPAYSAKHVAGERAYALARRGEAVTLEAVPVRIDAIEIERYEWPELEVTVRCGSGTYIRSLARDIGLGLGTEGHCAALRRLASGPFRVEDALAWDDLADPDATRAALLPAWRAVEDLPEAELDDAARRAFAQGMEVRLSSDAGVPAGWVRVHGPRGFVGMAEASLDPDGGVRLQPRRLLFPDGEDAEDAA